MRKVVTGIGYDSHKLVEGRKLIIGGVHIESKLGLLAHSDGDVLIHSIIDAILGASGMKDIGTLFPDSDLKYKNISSIELLKEVKKLIDTNIIINYIDSVIILEEPKLKNYIDKMKENISAILNIKVDQINIKSKTNEKMGFVGRNEGIVVMSTATLERTL